VDIFGSGEIINLSSYFLFISDFEFSGRVTQIKRDFCLFTCCPSLIDIANRWEPLKNFYDPEIDQESAVHFIVDFWNAQHKIKLKKPVEFITDIPKAGYYRKSGAISI
jgi:hypothetical protein